MKETRLIMGMPITVEIADKNVNRKNLECIFDYFNWVDQKFSTYKETSEISAINRGELEREDYSAEMNDVMEKCEETKKATNGYFDIEHQGKLDPSGLVKGWAIWKAAGLIKKMGYKNYYVEAGGDIQLEGHNSEGKDWVVGIRNPFNRYENVKIVRGSKMGVATSGTYIRGQHVYNPYKPKEELTEIVSLTVIGPNIYEADRMATAAFAMGVKGIEFIQNLPMFDAYMINNQGVATYTTGFERYVYQTT